MESFARRCSGSKFFCVPGPAVRGRSSRAPSPARPRLDLDHALRCDLLIEDYVIFLEICISWLENPRIYRRNILISALFGLLLYLGCLILVEGQPWVPDGSTVGPRFLGGNRGSPHKNLQPWVPATSFLFCVRWATRPNCQPLTLSHFFLDFGGVIPR